MKIAPSVDFRRYRAFAGALAILAGLLLAAHFALEFAAARAGKSLEFVDSPLGWTDLGFAASRVSAIAASDDARDGLWLYVGMSSARQGLDPEALSRAVGHRTYAFGGSGGSFARLRAFADPLLRSGLPVSLGLVCVHPFWLAGSPPDESGPKRGANRFVSRRIFDNLHDAMSPVRERFVFAGRRSYFNHSARLALYNLRWRVFGILGLEPMAFAVPDADPAIARQRLELPEDFDPSLLSTLQSVRWRARLEAKTYAGDQVQEAALLDLLRGLSARKAKSVLVLMPEHSALRNRIPAVAEEHFFKVLADAGGDVVVWDLRSFVADEGFSDFVHLNSHGRELLDAEVARRIIDLAKANPRLTHAREVSS
jgi:hypothetical protein